jgi:F0F1-type ATP synthase membrane subunit b/b'
MSPIVSTFLFELTNFLLLTLLLGWLLFKPVRSVLQARQAAEKRQADELSARAADMERHRAELEQRQHRFEDEIGELRTKRLAAIGQEANAILTRARETAERERDAVRRGLAHLERVQVERLSAAVAVATRESIARLLRRLNAPDLDASLAQAACQELQRVTTNTLGNVLIESATPLSDTTRAMFEAVLNGHAATAEFHAVPDLGVGVRITTTHGLIDTSALGLARQAEGLVRTALADESFEVTT